MLNVQNLSVQFPGRTERVAAVREVSLRVAAGTIHGLVGESGAGKSTIGAAILGMVPEPGYRSDGTITLGQDRLDLLSPHEWHGLRGRRIAMIFQDPQTSLNPLMTIERQLVETIRTHRRCTLVQARDVAVALLRETGIPDARSRIRAYPHQYSGGMRQRVVIALALASEPDVVIADEPTTALDVAVQSQVLAVLRQTVTTRRIATVLITHDIGVIAQVSDQVTVLRRGRVVEQGPTGVVLGSPRHEYTRALLSAVPPLDRRLERFPVPGSRATVPGRRVGAELAIDWLMERPDTDRERSSAALEVRGVTVAFAGARAGGRRAPPLVACAAVSFVVPAGRVLGLVGESGSGKSTIAKVIAGLVEPRQGALRLFGEELPTMHARGRRHRSRRQIQIVFQDPYSSLNNRRTIGAILSDPLVIFGLERDRKQRRAIVRSFLDLVGLPERAIDRYPHQFSGGERQRIAVARALLSRPSLLLCDEPTSSLDVSIQAQVLNLLRDLQREFALSLLFISHDLAVVRQMADTIAVMKEGRVIETAENDAFFAGPAAAYSRELLRLTPTLVPDMERPLSKPRKRDSVPNVSR